MPHVTFVHGIANKPSRDVLLRIWRESLARDEGLDLGAEGVTSSMVYWADVMYKNPQKEMAEHESNDSVIVKTDEDAEMAWRDGLKEEEEKIWIDSLTKKLGLLAAAPEGDDNFQPSVDQMESVDFERIPLPWWLKRRFMKAFLRDVHHYLFNSESTPREGETYRVQDEVRNRFVQAIREGSRKAGPHIVVSHSMGTVIAYDCLKRVTECPQIDALMTIGSPLGLDEIQDKLQPEWSRDNGFPETVVNERWANIYDKLDPVAGLDPKVANDYRRESEAIVLDINEQNYGRWRHNISKYLGGNRLRSTLVRQLNL